MIMGFGFVIYYKKHRYESTMVMSILTEYIYIAASSFRFK